MSKPKTGYYKANQGFATVYDGENVFVQQGELVAAGHPLLKGREDLFDHVTSFGRFDNTAKDDSPPVEQATDDSPPVEQATAAPGEKRGARSGR